MLFHVFGADTLPQWFALFGVLGALASRAVIK